ncbi:MAG: hypothetical protein ACE141_00105 [Bryobacteraceae bacterium]
MLLSDVLEKLGEENFAFFVRGVSIGKLKTYQMYESFKVRSRLHKLNSENLRKAIPRLWARVGEKDEEFAKELAQVFLLSHLDLILAVLEFLGIPNENGFFAKNLDASAWLTPGWQKRVYEKFHGQFPEPALLLYINHLAWELDKPAECFLP